MKGLYALLSAGIITGEHFLKNHVEKRHSVGKFGSLLAGRIQLWKYHNYGAFYNLGEKRPVVLRILSVLLTIVIFCLFILSLGTHGNTFLRMGLSLLLGGSFSNTYDRLKRGYVVDYFSIRCPIPWLANLVFNLADFCIMIGALLICLQQRG